MLNGSRTGCCNQSVTDANLSSISSYEHSCNQGMSSAISWHELKCCKTNAVLVSHRHHGRAARRLHHSIWMCCKEFLRSANFAGFVSGFNFQLLTRGEVATSRNTCREVHSLRLPNRLPTSRVPSRTVISPSVRN